MIRNITLSILILLAFALPASAQSVKGPIPFDNMFGFAWDVNFPVGNDFLDKTSLYGFKLEYRRGIKHNFSVGTEIAWNSYYQYVPRTTYQLKDGAITTDLYKYIYTLPLAVNAHWYFSGGKMFYPYAGLALGATYSEQDLYYNTYVTEVDNWGFLIRPEIGAIIKPSEHSGFGILVGARYSYSTNKEDDFKIDGLKSVGLQLGVVFMQ
ncbi:outer membrane beta-barrel protein [Flavihumibacter petaseus]|nr:outer membrane beta-barrel protein [Flavihumibacter petaseus]